MKRLLVALCAVLAALMLGLSASAETIDYTVTGWGTVCASSNFTGIQGNCMDAKGRTWGDLAEGTITGTAQWVGTAAGGGILTVTSDIYVTAGTPGVGPATISTTSQWFGLDQQSDPAGLTVVDGGPGIQTCTPTTDVICNTPRTPLPVANIDIYGPGATPGGTVVYLLQELASGGANKVWYEYTLTVVPEPGTALLLGLGLMGLATSRKR